MSGWPFDDTIPDVEMVARATVRQRQTDNGLQPLGDKLVGQLLTAGQLVTMPPPRWLIDDLLGASTLAVLYGKPGSGKSFLALDWALCVAAGFPWNGREVRRGIVLYVAAEGVGGLGIRVRAWTETFGVDVAEISRIRFFPTAINLLDQARRQALVEMTMTLEPTLVIIDTLARSMVGGDENSTRDVGLAIDAADHVKNVTGATVLVVHHTSKGGETYRGSSSIEGAADTMILVEAEGANLTVKCEKAKDAEQFELIKLTRSVVTLRGQMTTSCVIQSHTGRGTTDELVASEQALMAIMWDLLGTTAAVSRTELKDLAKLPKQTFYRATKSLVSKGALLNVGTMSRPVYKLPAQAAQSPESHESHAVPLPHGTREEKSHDGGVSRRTPPWDSLEPDWAKPEKLEP
jgi:hypothetical protein